MLRNVVQNVFGTLQIETEGGVVDFGKDFKEIKFFDLLKEYAGMDDPTSLTLEEAQRRASELAIKIEKGDAIEDIVDKIYKKTCRPHLIEPTFIVEYPVAFSPFAKRLHDNPEFIDRFQLVVGGVEIINAFSELNNPIDQEERFLEQDRKRKAGNAEVSPSDKEFIEAMEYGMPPAGGVGIGIDRLVMLLTNTKNIREIILFPTMRQKNEDQ